MKALLFAVLLFSFQLPAKPKVPAEWIKLRDEFVAATVEYKQSLTKLKPFYEQGVVRAEEKLAAAKDGLSRGTMSQAEVEATERALQSAKEKVEEVGNQIVKAEWDIKEASDNTKLEATYQEALAQRRKSRRPPCARWTIRSYYRETDRSIESSYKFVCIK